MTVSKLIKELQAFDPNSDVFDEEGYLIQKVEPFGKSVKLTYNDRVSRLRIENLKEKQNADLHQ